MNRDEMLAGLLAQAAKEGGDLATLRAVVEEACEIGANRVLSRIGLGDKGAEKDIDELRELLAAWRAAKASAWQAAVAWVVRGVFALLLIGIALQTGLLGRIGVPGLVK